MRCVSGLGNAARSRPVHGACDLAIWILWLVTATKSKRETRDAATKNDNWKCHSSNRPKISTAKQQWSKQSERDRANDDEGGGDIRCRVKLGVYAWPKT